MKTDDFDKTLEDLQDQLKKIGTSDIEEFLKENYYEKWSVLTDDQKQSTINEIKNYRDNPQNKSKIRRMREKLKHFESIKLNLGVLFLGVLLGISGNLVANLLDRSFVHYGFVYDFAVTVIFFFSLWYIDRIFIRKIGKEILNDKTVIDLFSILEKFESK